MSELVFKSPSELQVELGERLRQIRLSRNMDQRMAAEKAGVSERALRNLETGRGSTVETLLRALKAFGFLEGIEMLAPQPTVNPLALLHSPKPPRRARRPRGPRKARR